MTDTKMWQSRAIEVWLSKSNIDITCTLVREDETTTKLDVDSLSMRGAQREITGWLISQGYEPAGRWEAQEDGEYVRQFKTSHGGFVEAPAFVEVWNVRRETVSERQPCRYAWRVGPVGGDFRLLTRHRIPLLGGGEGRNLVIVDEDGGLLWAQPIIGFPVRGAELVAGPIGI